MGCLWRLRCLWCLRVFCDIRERCLWLCFRVRDGIPCFIVSASTISVVNNKVFLVVFADVPFVLDTQCVRRVALVSLFQPKAGDMQHIRNIVCGPRFQHKHVVHQHGCRPFRADKLVLRTHMGVVQYALSECCVAQCEYVADGVYLVALEQLHHLALRAFPHFTVLPTFF